MSRIICSFALLLLAFAGAQAQEQSGVSAWVVASVARARTLADAGNGTRARDLLDSLVTVLPREGLDVAEALYWRASLSEESAQAERDWKRLIVDVPFSPRAGDALLRLSELDLTRNEASLARQRVQRMLADHPDSPERPRALLVLARAYFGENDGPRACGVLTVARREAPLSAVEVRMQADELQQQCRNVREIAMGSAPDSTRNAVVATIVAPPVVNAAVVPPVTSAKSIPPGRTLPPVKTEPPIVAPPITPPAKTAPPIVAPPVSAPVKTIPPVVAPPVVEPPVTAIVPPVNAPPISNQGDTAVFKVEPHPSKTVVVKARPSLRYTVQIAAYDTHPQAEAVVKRLAAKRIDARVAGTKAPFRVQVGHYATRAEAASALVTLKKKGQKGFVTETGAP